MQYSASGSAQMVRLAGDCTPIIAALHTRKFNVDASMKNYDASIRTMRRSSHREACCAIDSWWETIFSGVDVSTYFLHQDTQVNVSHKLMYHTSENAKEQQLIRT